MSLLALLALLFFAATPVEALSVVRNSSLDTLARVSVYVAAGTPMRTCDDIG